MSGNSKEQEQAENPPKRSECECECHTEGSNIVHTTPCCVPDETDGKDGKDYF